MTLISKKISRAPITLLALSICLSACSGITNVEPGDPLLPTSTAENKPNIVLIVADDLGYHDVGSYGNTVINTPNIDRLAREGMSFDNAFVPASMCSPSRAALYTGMYPHKNGMARNHSQAKTGTKSMPHYLTELGYRTALVGKSHVKPFSVFPFERLERNLADVSHYLDEVDQNPFLMVIAQHHPHIPWLRNKVYNPDEIVLSKKLLDTPETRDAVARYYSSVSAADEELGAYLNLFEERGLQDNTVIIFMSDHGPQLPFAKFSNYDASLRVPLIVRMPDGLMKDVRTTNLSSSVDLLPTIIEIAGGGPPSGIDGHSLMDTIKGGSKSTHSTVFGTHSTKGLNLKDIKPYGIRTARTATFRYVKNLHPQNTPRSFLTDPRPFKGSIKYLRRYGVWVSPGLTKYWQSWLDLAKSDTYAAEVVNSYLHRPTEELYDTNNDPDELNNLAGLPQYQSTLNQLRGELVCWAHQQGDPELELIGAPDQHGCGAALN